MKTVIVTGTSQGLGLAIARKLIKRGYTVVGVSRHPAPTDLSAEAQFIEKLYDLSEVEGIPELCTTIIKEVGAPYALVNNAALGLDGVLATQANKDIRAVIDVNLVAPILLTKYLARHMLEKREGRIINISSVVASTGYKGLSVYASTKSAMLGFTKSLSRELGPRNITVNAIQPGFMKTSMSEAISESNLEKIRRRSPLGRLPEISDVVDAVEYLIGVSGANITGQSIIIDAGNSA